MLSLSQPQPRLLLDLRPHQVRLLGSLATGLNDLPDDGSRAGKRRAVLRFAPELALTGPVPLALTQAGPTGRVAPSSLLAIAAGGEASYRMRLLEVGLSDCLHPPSSSLSSSFKDVP